MGKRDDPVNSQETLAGLVELEARYARLAAEEPPALLDQAVLNLARREAAAGHGKRKTALRWIGALSTASLLVLTLSLVTRQEHGPPQSPAVPSPDHLRLERSKKSEQQAEPAAGSQILDELRQPATSQVAPQPVPQAAQESGLGAGQLRDEPVLSRRQVPADPGIMQKSADAVTKAGGQAGALPSESDGVESESTDSDEQRGNKENLSADPAAWLQHILRLQEDGLDAEVADQLQSFREIYPEYPLPDSLRD